MDLAIGVWILYPSQSGYHQIARFGGIKQCKCMVILRDLPLRLEGDPCQGFLYKLLALSPEDYFLTGRSSVSSKLSGKKKTLMYDSHDAI